MPKNDHYVIIGNGPAGNRAAEVLRGKDKDARISIISDEGFSFYYRHMLCDFIAGKKNEEALRIRPYQEYKEKNIRVRLGQRVEKIDPENRILYLKHMEKVGYTKLILATGAKHRIIPSLTIYEKYFTFMTGYSDALDIKPKLQKIKKAVVLGGDLISINFTKMLSRLNKEVTFLFYKENFWPVECTDEMAEAVSSGMKKRKISTFLDAYPSRITRANKGFTLKIDTGETIDADAIFCFMGLSPNIDFIMGSGIDAERGVLVNEFLESNYKDIYACGGCSQIYSPEYKDYWISIGWENAFLQGETAALNMLGAHKVIKPSPKKILQVEGIKINTSWWKKL